MKIFLIGFMGCGKSHWGKALSEKLSLPFFDLDKKIEEKEEKKITAIFEEEGEERFRIMEKEVLHLLTESHDAFVMATGGGTPCFYNNIEYMKKQGIVVWINSSLECLYERLAKEKDSRPLIKDLEDEQLMLYISKKYADRKIFYQQATLIISEEQVTIDNMVNKIFHITKGAHA